MFFPKSTHLLFKLRPSMQPFKCTSTRNLSQKSRFDGLVRPITVRTCVNLYPKLHQQNPRLYPANAPTGGIDLTVDYLDTALDELPYSKTVLALPGSAGYYKHFEQLINHFRGTDVRVVAPNFPDFSHTRATKVYWHSNVEMVAFLKNFLEQIGVQKIDCAVSHSMGVHRILGLVENPGPIDIKSIAFLAPQPLYDLKQKHINKVRRVFFTFRNELFYNLLDLSRIYKLPQIPVKFKNIDDFLLFLVPVLDTSYQNLSNQLAVLVNTQIPVTVFYGTNEKFISSYARQRLLDELGIKQENVITIDPARDKPDIVLQAAKLKAFYIKGGGHFAYANYEQFTNQMIDDLLQN